MDSELKQFLEICVRQTAAIQTEAAVYIAIDKNAHTYFAQYQCDSTSLAIAENAIMGERIETIMEELENG